MPRIRNTNHWISKTRGGAGYQHDLTGIWGPTESAEEERVIKSLYDMIKDSTIPDTIVSNKLQETIIKVRELRGLSFEDPAVKEEMNKQSVLIALNDLIAFFTEFEFTPGFRFVNTLAHKVSNNKKAAKEYITNYFRLSDSSCSNSIIEKIDSAEFNNILDNLGKAVPTKTVNNRFKVYYGPQGTGKTTDALNETSDCMVCHSAMLPSDLMEDFKFVDGKATFDPSPLWNAMEAGTPIVLDEINLLPFESLRFLQSILDGKAEFIYKGREVKINDGFKVIGTMNLFVNEMTYPLPAPLVDRCEEIKEYSITGDNLMSAIF